MQGLVEGPGTGMRAAHQYSRILGGDLGLRRSLNRSREIDAYLVKQSPFCCTGGHLYAHQSLQKLGITGLEAGLNGVQDRGTIQISLSERLQSHSMWWTPSPPSLPVKSWNYLIISSLMSTNIISSCFSDHFSNCWFLEWVLDFWSNHQLKSNSVLEMELDESHQIDMLTRFWKYILFQKLYPNWFNRTFWWSETV